MEISKNAFEYSPMSWTVAGTELTEFADDNGEIGTYSNHQIHQRPENLAIRMSVSIGKGWGGSLDSTWVKWCGNWIAGREIVGLQE